MFGRAVPREERLIGGVYGALIGDALGVPYEFHAAEELPPYTEIEMTLPAGFHRAHAGIKPGTWSDDCALAPCFAGTRGGGAASGTRVPLRTLWIDRRARPGDPSIESQLPSKQKIPGSDLFGRLTGHSSGELPAVSRADRKRRKRKFRRSRCIFSGGSMGVL